MVNGESGKGDTYRKVDPKKYQANFSKIFPPKPKSGGKEEKELRKGKRDTNNRETS